ncbi:acylphosphatase [Acinetobacter sp. ULE_I010]|mgnify:CR=1 FL=1|uniref:acylphosphatase n=1 Tax=Acinetobacter sp. ULE_I010 TaxID=3373065 RepID=UPI003AF8E809
MKAVKLIIRGKVQCVGYRRWFEKEALKLHLKGYVKNLDDGDVEAVIIGNEQAVLSIIWHAYVGPLSANVSLIQQHDMNVQVLGEFSDFKMLR